MRLFCMQERAMYKSGLFSSHIPSVSMDKSVGRLAFGSPALVLISDSSKSSDTLYSEIPVSGEDIAFRASLWLSVDFSFRLSLVPFLSELV